jgi:hypothetical protein
MDDAARKIVSAEKQLERQRQSVPQPPSPSPSPSLSAPDKRKVGDNTRPCRIHWQLLGVGFCADRSRVVVTEALLSADRGGKIRHGADRAKLIADGSTARC